MTISGSFSPHCGKNMIGWRRRLHSGSWQATWADPVGLNVHTQIKSGWGGTKDSGRCREMRWCKRNNLALTGPLQTEAWWGGGALALGTRCCHTISKEESGGKEGKMRRGWEEWKMLYSYTRAEILQTCSSLLHSNKMDPDCLFGVFYSSYFVPSAGWDMKC